MDFQSFDHEFVAAAPGYCSRYDRGVWVLDVTSDPDVPTFVALSRSPCADSEDIIDGAGAHADPRLAAQRAICELNQCLTWLPGSGQHDGRPRIDDPLALWWWKTARLANCPWLVPVNDHPHSTTRTSPVIDSADTRDDVEN